MRFSVLGPVMVTTTEGRVVSPTGIPRDLLVALLLRANQVVSKDHLISALWEERPPESAEWSLRNHVMRLRRQFGADAAECIRTVTPGYLVQVGDEELDQQVFSGLCAQGRKALRAGDWTTASDTLARALALWRDEPFADVRGTPEIQAEARRLQETRIQAWEDRIDAELHLGRHQELIGQARALTLTYPMHEAFHGQLMLALYRAGRQAESLEVFHALRGALVDELAVEPSPPIQELYRRLLDADPELAAPVPTPDSPASAGPAEPVAETPVRAHDDGPRQQLPADTRAFTGRTVELAQLVAHARQVRDGEHTGTVVVSAIDGMAGIGKSALAVHAAHRVRESFPDGQLFLDLHGHTPGAAPLTAAEALDRLLHSLGVPPQLVPQELDQRAAFYRDRLVGTRTLILLDNATGAAQIRPLLPATAGCLVLVTSRRRLTGLDEAQSIALDVLSASEAVGLLHAVAGPGRIPRDHPAVGELTALCGHMPLAIRIVAAQLRHRPALGLEDILRRLQDDHVRLSRLFNEDRSLTAVFESSYAVLPVAERRLFRLLGLLPGQSIDVYAAAALNGTDDRTAELLLESLLDHNLLTQRTPGRWVLHDLVRLYARDLNRAAESGEARERDAARERLLDYYQHTAQAADTFLARHTRPGPHAAGTAPAVGPSFADRADALAWMQTERHNLVAAVTEAGAQAEHPRVVAVTAALGAFFQQEGPWDQAAALHAAAAAAARSLGNRLDEAMALQDLCRIKVLVGNYQAATDLCEQALEAFQVLGNRRGEASALQELGKFKALMMDNPTGMRFSERALDIFQAVGDRLGEANTLVVLGRMHYMSGDNTTGAELNERALLIFQELGDPQGEANALQELGYLKRITGDNAGATALYKRALVIYRGLGTPLGEANALFNVGLTHYDVGGFRDAAELLERALAIYQDLGNRHGEANTLWGLGRVHYETHDIPGAQTLQERALAIFQTLGIRHGEANALHQLGRARHAAVDLPAAEILLKQALAIFCELGDPQGEAEVLNSMGALMAEAGEATEGLALHRQALRLAGSVNSPMDEARALEGSASCAARLGDRVAAVARLREATALYRHIESFRAAIASALLTALEEQEPGAAG